MKSVDHSRNLELLSRSAALAAIVAFASSCNKNEPQTSSPDQSAVLQSAPDIQLNYSLYRKGEAKPTALPPTPAPSEDKAKVDAGKKADPKSVPNSEPQSKVGQDITLPGYNIVGELEATPADLFNRITLDRKNAKALLTLAECVVGTAPDVQGKFCTDNGQIEACVVVNRRTADNKEKPLTELHFKVEESSRWSGEVYNIPPHNLTEFMMPPCLTDKTDRPLKY